MRTAPRSQLNRAIAPCRKRGPRRVAMVSMHTSPLEQPGTGDAGGMNVYVLQTARRLADRGVAVEIFTRATSSEQPPALSPSEGITVHYVPAGPFEGLSKGDLPSQLCAFTNGVLRAEAAQPPGYFDVIHSHYWLSGQAAWLAAERWGVPHIHSAHTLAKVKNLHLAAEDTPEPFTRVVGEEQVVAESDALVTNTSSEAEVLVDLYRADPDKVTVTPPGVDPEVFTPGDKLAARRRLGLPDDALVLGFAGRIQPLKAPDVLVRAVARLRALNPELAPRLRLVVVGGPSGNGADNPRWLHDLAAELGIADAVTFLKPRAGHELAEVFRACDVVGVPSYNETFGLVALEAQACGTPVVAAAVGGLTTAVADGHSGLLIRGHDETDWANALDKLVTDAPRRARLAAGALDHAARFTWSHTADDLLGAYGDAIQRRAVSPRRSPASKR
ncbi:D-inositol-3-phosphate glycosyltransferase [Stackebrandtia nassauensis]|uniref:D-inositol 3-phosphate glycosyltransferase n=1 Tax=Stackebrandtia nassauensis (strain DSM 44728 / CIP 108903 / NRRL B-16338 / NBRC 102104 / LLR-40K-21) TaxID=446470 RepID=MSHA_STANL|nr:D-inositol-3-phosphate glycosyltransferase [Stackebrandtia nassauensis]D3Q051.1 RecName: Full=D-inositol 3-phosphate glycosyltransferase; AltName: Full=N-acetylglucosamine-inositol-phosphate N-acetylglucosaminyltransferase; Short=GlcNAc-Ins-P N-acetylglucosaminyltransferase [Stackebrandtia nassauensis DSM 44728]ADD45580.1 UDP-N-acetylglucosamine [Stackebrandtia nassauensis DSM 44728]